ncbi:hypothetical protein PPERSA_12874 [Pseudocohnilembus persalinus]|uniref:Uncharacterized protein n=1 Tax=Pseudocohnilembus persalinus TaxID=266149 RepID=A0A0V0Q8C0_PSEPJ|nr:hypothetical protein PPERSA_12874 [Pseudocohnilembus persalinus]|eukprot:KRW98395.1 hypothetical protein PPERSA_12874 [Pseudocohnilembus persalinus]
MGILKNQDNRQQENRQDSPTKNQTIAQSAQTNYNSTIEFGSSSKKPLNNRLTNSQNQIQIQSISKLVGNDQKQIEQKQKLEQIIRQKQRQRMQNEVQKQNQNQKQNKYNFNQQEIKSTQQNNKKDSYSQNQSNRQFFNENDSQNQFQNKPRGLSFQTTKRTYSKNLYQNKTPIKRMQNSILGHKLENKERKSFSSLKKQEQQQEQQQYQFSQELQNEQKKEKNYEKKIMGQEVGNKNNLKNDRKSLENSINSIENGKEDQENQGLIQENEKYNQISQIHDSQLEEQLEQGINQRQNNHKNINKNQQRKINMSRQSLMSQDLNQSQIRMHTDEVWEDSPLKK